MPATRPLLLVIEARHINATNSIQQMQDLLGQLVAGGDDDPVVDMVLDRIAAVEGSLACLLTPLSKRIILARAADRKERGERYNGATYSQDSEADLIEMYADPDQQQ